ncbi:MAG: chromate transporter [Acholeplasmatales bacterium]|nr:MAG: chromate transporter [Acholeplasmatales bacterium]
MSISSWRLMMVFLKIGALTFGGGYAMIPLIERELVYRYKLLKPEAFYDTLLVCQSLPGAIAINFAVMIGLKLKGWRGALAGLFGTVLPSFVIILVIAMFFFRFVEEPLVEAFFKGVRLSVVALMFLAGWKLFKRARRGIGLFVIVLTFALIIGFSTHPFLVIVLMAGYGIAIGTMRGVVRRDVA